MIRGRRGDKKAEERGSEDKFKGTENIVEIHTDKDNRKKRKKRKTFC